MLYSEKQGTGKSTLADVLKALFGKQNTGRTNGVSKLVGRFNKEVLENKLVIVEEVEVKRGSPQANSLKSLVTEDCTMVEAKHLPAYVEDIYCAFLMTTNHLPLWLEESDRRFFIMEFDHQGYANGGSDYSKFTRLVGDLKNDLKSDAGIKGIYDQLMAREVAPDFGLKLDIRKHRTEFMSKLADLSPDVAKQLLEEKLNNRDIVFVPVELANKLINKIAPREINAQTHLFTELGWSKGKFAWGGRAQQRAWYRIIDHEKPPTRGKIYVGKTVSLGLGSGWVDMQEQVERVEKLVRSVAAQESEDAPEIKQF
jgi:hypothetical protein